FGKLSLLAHLVNVVDDTTIQISQDFVGGLRERTVLRNRKPRRIEEAFKAIVGVSHQIEVLCVQQIQAMAEVNNGSQHCGFLNGTYSGAPLEHSFLGPGNRSRSAYLPKIDPVPQP